MTNTRREPRFGVDLITFFHPSFWELDDGVGLEEKAGKDPAWVWDKMLDAVAAAGITDLELTFAPADYDTALAAYGDVAGFRAALDARGLGVVSGYFSGLEKSSGPVDARIQSEILESADRYARFLAAVGGRYLVTGLPMRTTRGTSPASFVDLAYAGPVADVVNRIGETTLAHGILTTLHTESHSVFWTPRDVDLFMLLTDPMYVGMCPDTGHIALAGADPAHLIDRHRDRLAIAHWKDAVGPVPLGMTIDEGIFERQAGYFRRAGAGVVDWFGWTRLLKQVGYSDTILLELDAVADPVSEMQDARRYLTAVAASLDPRPGTEPPTSW
jgi:inosose dehydratase